MKPTLSRNSKGIAVGKGLPIRDVRLLASIGEQTVIDCVPRVAAQFRNLEAAYSDGSVKGSSPVIISAISRPVTGPSVKP